jgi:hypothetical protein
MWVALIDSVARSVANTVHTSQRTPTGYAQNKRVIHNILRFLASLCFLSIPAGGPSVYRMCVGNGQKAPETALTGATAQRTTEKHGSLQPGQAGMWIKWECGAGRST